MTNPNSTITRTITTSTVRTIEFGYTSASVMNYDAPSIQNSYPNATVTVENSKRDGRFWITVSEDL